MTGTRKRCDCELGLNEAKEGDLPPVCLWCGDATNQFYNLSLYYLGRRIRFRFPLCESDKNHWRYQSFPLWGIIGVAILIAVGIGLVTVSLDLPPSNPLIFLLADYGLLAVLGLICFCILWIAHAVLATRSIRIRRLGRTSVTLTYVAPEFVEALRVYRLGLQVPGASHPFSSPNPETSELAAPDLPWGEESMQIVEVASLEARDLGHDYLGTNHLLLALRCTSTPAAKALQALGFDAEQLREACRAATPASSRSPSAREVPTTPAVRRAFAQAAVEAHTRNHASVRAGHLMLALLREPENEAVQLLLDLGVSPEEAGRRSVEAIQLLEGVMTREDVEARQGIAPGPTRGGGVSE
jgi:Clp amino terminal domain, pathogenicity island component